MWLLQRPKSQLPHFCCCCARTSGFWGCSWWRFKIGFSAKIIGLLLLLPNHSYRKSHTTYDFVIFWVRHAALPVLLYSMLFCDSVWYSEKISVRNGRTDARDKCTGREGGERQVWGRKALKKRKEKRKATEEGRKAFFIYLGLVSDLLIRTDVQQMQGYGGYSLKWSWD